MSWLGGNENTSFITDLKSLWHNATTGELTQEQKTEIATAATNEYLPCKNNYTDQNCIELRKSQNQLVEIVAPSTDCTLRISDNYCFTSWTEVAFVAIGILFIFLLLYGVITSWVVRR